MSAIKTYKGAELDLEHYKGKSIVDFEFEMLDDQDEPLDLSIYSGILLKIYAKRNGTEIDSFSIGAGLSVTDNFITWDATKVEMNLYRVGLVYYHHCYGVLTSDGEEDLFFYGNSPIK